ncbi:hypothetical protein AX774_g8009 [Zancudomyces culisetae]|uniref:Uncharacterized protein n=1 Tax=Zancudomyces culisetae TaxID=1213189 RepID=A0A1R1PCA5_ZANCU|nr:hypothetical protein AX774_g8009 [Zancudomyces culisetae]|eukprot:OMH78594.1 hypothetical protein AX774_g8009 [Zancudomyces culisetae]
MEKENVKASELFKKCMFSVVIPEKKVLNTQEYETLQNIESREYIYKDEKVTGYLLASIPTKIPQTNTGNDDESAMHSVDISEAEAKRFFKKLRFSIVTFIKKTRENVGIETAANVDISAGTGTGAREAAKASDMRIGGRSSSNIGRFKRESNIGVGNRNRLLSFRPEARIMGVDMSTSVSGTGSNTTGTGRTLKRKSSRIMTTIQNIANTESVFSVSTTKKKDVAEGAQDTWFQLYEFLICSSAGHEKAGESRENEEEELELEIRVANKQLDEQEMLGLESEIVVARSISNQVELFEDLSEWLTNEQKLFKKYNFNKNDKKASILSTQANKNQGLVDVRQDVDMEALMTFPRRMFKITLPIKALVDIRYRIVQSAPHCGAEQVFLEIQLVKQGSDSGYGDQRSRQTIVELVGVELESSNLVVTRISQNKYPAELRVRGQTITELYSISLSTNAIGIDSDMQVCLCVTGRIVELKQKTTTQLVEQLENRMMIDLGDIARSYFDSSAGKEVTKQLTSNRKVVSIETPSFKQIYSGVREDNFGQETPLITINKDQFGYGNHSQMLQARASSAEVPPVREFYSSSISNPTPTTTTPTTAGEKERQNGNENEKNNEKGEENSKSNPPLPQRSYFLPHRFSSKAIFSPTNLYSASPSEHSRLSAPNLNVGSVIDSSVVGESHTNLISTVPRVHSNTNPTNDSEFDSENLRKDSHISTTAATATAATATTSVIAPLATTIESLSIPPANSNQNIFLTDQTENDCCDLTVNFQCPPIVKTGATFSVLITVRNNLDFALERLVIKTNMDQYIADQIQINNININNFNTETSALPTKNSPGLLLLPLDGQVHFQKFGGEQSILPPNVSETVMIRYYVSNTQGFASLGNLTIQYHYKSNDSNDKFFSCEFEAPVLIYIL